MKSAIKKTALLAALCILAISVLLHGVFWYISLDEINKNLKQSADSISQEIDSLNYSPNDSYENFAIVKMAFSSMVKKNHHSIHLILSTYSMEMN